MGYMLCFRSQSYEPGIGIACKPSGFVTDTFDPDLAFLHALY
ncbi:hypothetical protein PAHA111176_19890 [Parendozoicomonas haliclonae]|uniref:Uncharacterized protein n=1 Tax=Parendozoicomonas haliclonae TaxID=1960125 RepID=A0A1X7APX9_9GAMM|nr:hypothetical protein EHSB41UT_03965 [Parendozoicomonas haliclonae]